MKNAVQPRMQTDARRWHKNHSWERWRPAGEFQFSASDQPAGRRRSQNVHGARGCGCAAPGSSVAYVLFVLAEFNLGFQI
jgi:hypothetical protein